MWTITRNKIHDHFRSQAKQAQAAGGSAAQARIKDVRRLPANRFLVTAVSLEKISALSESDLSLILGVEQLSTLHLDQSVVTNAMVETISNYKELQALYLRGTLIKDEGARVLPKLENLDSLDLSRTKITDKALEHLTTDSGLKKLRWLNLKNTAVTTEGVHRFHKSLPQCEIEWNGGTISQTENDTEKQGAALNGFKDQRRLPVEFGGREFFELANYAN